MVICSGVRFTFHDYESPNGTNESRGQIPELYVRLPQANAYHPPPAAPRQGSAPTPPRAGSSARGLRSGDEAADGGAGEGSRPKEGRNVYAANG